jgi:hypothetical protein
VGKILVTQAVHDRANSDLADCQAQDYQLKGFESPIKLFAA